MSSTIFILGIDPGFASTGFALVQLEPSGERVVALGVIRTEKSSAKRQVLAADDNLRRARELAAALAPLMARPEVRALACEAMSFPRNASTAGKMCLCWGALAALTERYRLPLVQASPQEVKRAVCGRKDAGKDDVRFDLLKRYGNGIEDLLEGVPAGKHEHPFDALASVVACLDAEVVRAVRPREVA